MPLYIPNADGPCNKLSVISLLVLLKPNLYFRLRLASPEAISCLLSYGADPSALCVQNTDEMVTKPAYHNESFDGPNFGLPTSTPLSLVLATAATMHSDAQCSKLEVGKDRDNKGDEQLTAKRGAERSWVQVAGVLLRSGKIIFLSYEFAPFFTNFFFQG